METNSSWKTKVNLIVKLQATPTRGTQLPTHNVLSHTRDTATNSRGTQPPTHNVLSEDEGNDGSYDLQDDDDEDADDILCVCVV